MQIHRRTLLQAMLVLPIATIATRSQKVLAFPHVIPSLAQTQCTCAPTSHRWVMDAELTPCPHYNAQDALSALKISRHARPCVLHVPL